jgi:chromate transporter
MAEEGRAMANRRGVGRRLSEVFLAFLRLGLTSFGGPIAHLGYFRNEFVARRRWLDEARFAQIVALCQFLPGPASSQVGIIIGYERAGAFGSLAAWSAFTLPSAIVLAAFAYGVRVLPGIGSSHWIHGLLLAAVAVVAIAVTSMARSLAPDASRKTLAAAVAIGALLAPVAGYVQLALIAIGALVGWLLFARSPSIVAQQPAGSGEEESLRPESLRIALACAVVLVVLLVGLPLATHLVHFGPLVAFAKFFDVGAFVFGGGHVVLPLLQAQVVPPGWISNERFLAGYGAAQAVPGPLFTFSAYLGAAMDRGPVHGIAGAALCLIAIYLPSFLLIAAVLPFWYRVSANRSVRAVLQGVNAAVVGLLLGALYNPVWVSSVRSAGDVAVVLAGVVALGIWRAPPWSVVLGCAVVAGITSL